MAFRRSFRRSAPRRFKRRGVRVITETKRWESANFFFSELFTATPLTSDVVAWDLMSVAHFSNFGTDPRQLQDAIRTVEIGGIVWDTNVEPAGSSAASAFGGARFFEVLATDRLDVNDNPASLVNMDWSLTQSPVSGSGSGAVDGDFPTRIHLRRTKSALGAPSNPTAAQVGFATRDALSQAPWRTQSVRIKGGLGDRQGIFFFHQLLNEDDNVTVTTTVQIAGTLYYRIRY